MESQNGDGPDDSSLKPVSSLRAQWENMNKAKAATVNASPSTAPALRNRSPSPKPPPLPDTRPARGKSTRQGEGRNTTTPTIESPLPHDGGDGTPVANHRHSRLGPPPTLAPKPIRPPSVLIEPPQSPPRARVANFADANSQLNLDPTKTPIVASTPSPRPFKISSRPITPSLEQRKSPRLSPSPQPPSPPPPRRSGELRREREVKLPPPAPPPVNRADKPRNRLSQLVENGHRLDPAVQVPETSPFSSPPESPDHEQPPVLPMRPPRPVESKPGLVRTNAIPVQFDPPPVHHSIASRRRDQEMNGHVKGAYSYSVAADPPGPALPSRPQTVTRERPASMRPPPRPPRLGTALSSTSVTTDEGSASQPKRVVSTPTSVSTPTMQQFAPPPKRSHGRSMTVDRTSDKTPVEFREPPRRMGTVADRSARGVESQTPSATSVSTHVNASYPDSSNMNRRAPFTKKGIHEIQTKYDARLFDLCGPYVCTSGSLTRVWSLLDGDLVMSFSHGEGVKATAVAFKCGYDVDDEGTRLWIGTNNGELMEADIATQSLVGNKSNAHGRIEVIKIYRHLNEMWTLDEGGTLHVWGPDSEGTPNLNNPPHQTYRLPRGHSFSMIVYGELWHATGKEIRVFAPTADARTQVQVSLRPMVAEGAGEVTSGALVKTQPGKVFFGHVDGKISIWSQKDFNCLSVLSISTYKINCLVGVGHQMWAGFNPGRMCVYDVETSPWVVKKEWQAHENPVVKVIADSASFYRLDRLNVVSLGADNLLKVWDGLLQDDFLESEMKSLEAKYCEFDDIKAMVVTWNAGASTPNSLRYDAQDAGFIQNLLQTSDTPDILVFGFQELVDLEDKTATAKRLFKSKKKDAVTDQERMSHQYRDWRDFLVRSLDDYMPADCLYHLLHTSTLVGLFTCIFVKSTIRDRVSNLSSVDVKRGLGGLHGNKGAIIVRFMVDDTSMCFLNCHLAAGQSQANQRHHDLAEIIDSGSLPIERNQEVRIDSYIGGGDGTMVLDHELCILNGDLNYRIDTMSRDTVVNAVKANNLPKLLDRDQLLVARRRKPDFKLRAFEEMPITFAPTYKYDVGTDNYDTSEKKRSPAWCDRLLHRGRGKIQQLDYRRHEVRVSDHRPVSGRFRLTVKRVSPKHRAMTWAHCLERFEEIREREANEGKLYYLQYVIGYDATISQNILREKASRKPSRSPSRHLG